MSARGVGTLVHGRRPTAEVERLRQELAAVQNRLEEEMAYHRARVETSRQQIEAQHLRQQAAEVARRRRLEDQVATLELQLREAQEHGERVQRRYDELAGQFLRQEESTRDSVTEEVTRYKAAAQSAWQSAEEELAKMEGEMHRLREELSQERTRSRHLEDTLRSLQGLDGNGEEDEAAELAEELATLRKALDLSERRRVQLQKRGVRLAEQLIAMQGQVAELQEARETAAPRAEPGAAHVRRLYRDFHTGAGNPREVDLSEANAVLRSAASQGQSGAAEGTPEQALSLDDDIAEEFLLVSADSSLDRHKLERLQQQVERQEAQDRIREGGAAPARENIFLEEAPPRERPPAAATDAPATRNGPGRFWTRARWTRLTHTLALVALATALAGIGIWFLGIDLLP